MFVSTLYVLAKPGSVSSSMFIKSMRSGPYLEPTLWTSWFPNCIAKRTSVFCCILFRYSSTYRPIRRTIKRHIRHPRIDGEKNAVRIDCGFVHFIRQQKIQGHLSAWDMFVIRSIVLHYWRYVGERSGHQNPISEKTNGVLTNISIASIFKLHFRNHVSCVIRRFVRLSLTYDRLWHLDFVVYTLHVTIDLCLQFGSVKRIWSLK